MVVPIYNFTEYILNYSDTICSLWFYSKGETNNSNADIANNNAFKSLEYKPKLLDKIVADETNSTLKNLTIAVPSKYVSNF